jgi:hypothetical protein
MKKTSAGVKRRNPNFAPFWIDCSDTVGAKLQNDFFGGKKKQNLYFEGDGMMSEVISKVALKIKVFFWGPKD